MEDSVDPTLCNRYPNQEKEYIFCTKGRPFGCLVSPHLPTPTSSLIDYGLVRDVGMKMTGLQYTKLSFCGQKFRILGKVSVTVQTIHDGLASGNFHLKKNRPRGRKPFWGKYSYVRQQLIVIDRKAIGP